MGFTGITANSMVAIIKTAPALYKSDFILDFVFIFLLGCGGSGNNSLNFDKTEGSLHLSLQSAVIILRIENSACVD